MGKPMHISTRVVIDLATDTVVEREGYEYTGPLVECISGSGSSQKSKSKQSSSQESGTKYNEDFMQRALDWAGGKQNQSKENFDPAAYLKANPGVAADPNYGQDPYQHWLDFGQNDPNFKFTPKSTTPESPTYNPAYVQGTYTPGSYTGANFTGIAPEGFDKLEKSLYETQRSKLAQAYDTGVAKQREELAQSGALNSPSQYLEGSARSSLDRSYMQNLQQAARDAFTGRLGLEQTEAARKTGFDVGQAAGRTAFDTGEGARQTEFSTGEAGRQTGFNEQTAARLLDLWLKKLGIALEAGRYSRGESQGTSSGSGISGSGGIFKFGGSD